MFAKNLTMYLLGVACQVMAGVFPKLAGAFIGPGSLLLSAADVRTVLDGSFVKHTIVLVLAILCQVGAAAAPAHWNATAPLLAAGGILMSASDIKRVLKGAEKPAAPIVTPESAPTEKGQS